MRTVEENIKMLSRSILTDAQAEADKILEEARAKAETVRRRAEEQAKAERGQILEDATREAERLRGQVLATTQLKARTQILENREKVLNDVFKAAQEQLKTIQQWSEYREIALNLLREALVQLKGTDVVVRADKVTMKLLDDDTLKDIGHESKIKIKAGKVLEHGIGVIVETADGHLNYDNTLETRLSRMQNSARSAVYHLLMGETL